MINKAVLLLFQTIIFLAVGASHVYAIQTWFNCTPQNITVFDNRIHVRCENAADKITFFAVDSTNADLTNKAVSLAATAIAFSRVLLILYDPDDNETGPKFDCRVEDCRPIQAISLVK